MSVIRPADAAFWSATLNPVYVSPSGIATVAGRCSLVSRIGTHLHVVSVRRAGRCVTHPGLNGGRASWRVFDAGLVQHKRGGMVSQVLADTRHVADDGDAERFEVLHRANAGEHQQVWRIDGAARQE